jgi:hypothetical protein
VTRHPRADRISTLGASADLVLTDANLRPKRGLFAELGAACQTFCHQVNARPHRITRRPPTEMPGDERAWLDLVPAAPFTAALHVTGPWTAVGRDVRGPPALGAASPGWPGLGSSAWASRW